MLKNGWIKAFRSLQDWQWWSDEKMVKFFLYLLMNANTRDTYLDGVLIPRGSLTVSYSIMARDCNFSVKQLRGMLDKLIRTGEVAKQVTSKYTVITVNNYSHYQSGDKQKGKQRASDRAEKRASEGQQSKKANNIFKRREEDACAFDVLPDEKGAPPEGFSTWEEYYDYLSE